MRAGQFYFCPPQGEVKYKVKRVKGEGDGFGGKVRFLLCHYLMQSYGGSHDFEELSAWIDSLTVGGPCEWRPSLPEMREW
jgi:hypothetical protein